MVKNQVFKSKYSLLNDQQREAVDTIDGPVLVIAGPGSGKTELLSMRVANILKTTDTSANSILCLTFTDSAAQNMRQRLKLIIGAEANNLAIHTFHSFGTEIINQNPEYFFFGQGFRPADEIATISILEKILGTLSKRDLLSTYHPDHGWSYLYDIKSRIADLKKAGINPNEFLKIIEQNQKFFDKANPIISQFFIDNPKQKATLNWSLLLSEIEKIDSFESDYDYKTILFEELKKVAELVANSQKIITTPITAWVKKFCKKNYKNETVLKDSENQKKYLSFANIYSQYQSQLHANSLYDFDDMLLEVLNALNNYPELRFNCQEQYLYILVDEFQDTSGVQTRILDQLINLEVCHKRPNLMVVGDDDQAIYKFQGASLANILSFTKKYDKVKIVTLTYNYRSKQTILDMANTIIENSQIRLSRTESIDKTLISQV